MGEELSLIKGASEYLDLTLELDGEEVTDAVIELATEGDKISVDEYGDVVGLNYGQQEITVVAKVGGEVVASATVMVTVEEYGQLIVDLPENKLAMYVDAEGYALSQITAILNVDEVTEPVFTAVSANVAVAKIEDGKICPVAEGETTVVVSFEGEMNTYETTIYVTVSKQVVNKEVNFRVKGSGEETSAELGDATIDLAATEIDLSTVTAVLCNGEEVAFTVDGTSMTLTNAPGGYQYYTLVTPTTNYVVDGLIYGKAITTAEELLQWRDNAHSYKTYTILENDIDLGGETLSSAQVQIKGTLDGLGHTISNFNYSATSAFVYYNYGTVRNVQFINAVQDCTGSGNVNVGLLGNNNLGVIENVLARVVIKNLSSEAEHWGVLCYYLSKTSTVSNVIVHIQTEGSVPKYVYGIYCLNQEDLAVAVNAHAICDTATGVAGTTGATDCNYYASEIAMLNDVDVAEWGGYWQVDETDKAYMSDYSEAEANIAVVVNGVAKAGETITFKATSFYPVTFALAEDVAGVTMENNQVVLSDDAVPGTTFKVVATCQQLDVEKEFEFTVERTAVQIEGTFLAKGKDNQWSYATGAASFDLSGKGVDLSAVTSLLINGVEFTNYAVSGNVLTVTDAPGGDCIYTLTTETKDYNFTGCVYCYGISTVEELNTWRTTERYQYAVLLNDIDYEGAVLGEGANILSTLDGRGYTISNFTYGKGFVKSLHDAKAEIKNVAFKNVTQDCSNISSWPAIGIFGAYSKGNIENVYVQVTTQGFANEHCGIIVGNLQGNATVKNVVIDVTNAEAKKHYAFNSKEATVTVVGVVGSYNDTNGMSEIAGGWGPEANGFYASISEIVSNEIIDELTTFTSAYWVIDTTAGTIALMPLNKQD